MKSFGVEVIAPQHKYGKANLPSSHTVVVETIRELSKSPLRGKNILVTAGPTPGKIDYERIVTSRFRGRLDVKIADEAYMRGANVTLILGPGGIEGPPYLETIPTRDFYEYHSKVMGVIEQNPVDVGIFSAAVADYIPVEVFEGKIPSEGALESLRLKQTPKVVKEVRGKFPGLLMVTFKYEENISRKELKVIAQARMEEDYELVVANRGEDMNPQGDYGCIIVGKEGIIAEPSSRNECTMVLLDSLEKFYKG